MCTVDTNELFFFISQEVSVLYTNKIWRWAIEYYVLHLLYHVPENPPKKTCVLTLFRRFFNGKGSAQGRNFLPERLEGLRAFFKVIRYLAAVLDTRPLVLSDNTCLQVFDCTIDS